MTPEQNELSRQLVAHPRFTLAVGMAFRTHYGSPWRVAVLNKDDVAAAIHGAIEWYAQDALLNVGDVLDLLDDATGGVLLGMVRAVYVGCVSFVNDGDGAVFLMHAERMGARLSDIGKGSTLAEACARALLSHWGPA